MTGGGLGRAVRWPLWSWRNLTISAIVVLAFFAGLGRMTNGDGSPAASVDDTRADHLGQLSADRAASHHVSSKHHVTPCGHADINTNHGLGAREGLDVLPCRGGHCLRHRLVQHRHRRRRCMAHSDEALGIRVADLVLVRD